MSVIANEIVNSLKMENLEREEIGLIIFSSLLFERKNGGMLFKEFLKRLKCDEFLF